MELSCLIKITKGSMESYDIDSKTPAEVKQAHDLNTRWYLEIYDDVTGEYSDLDLSLIFLETKLNDYSTWDEILENISDVIIRSYTTTLPTKDSKNLIVTHVLNSADFDLSYCNIDVPEDRNIKTFRWRMPDLVVTRTNNKNNTIFKNCICGVNGVISLPYVFKDELYIKDGARHMASTTDSFGPSVTLMDFSELGDIQIVPFKDCIGKFLNGSNSVYVKSATSDLKIYLPEEYDLSDKTVFAVIAHSLYLPESITVTGSRSLIISPYKLPIRSSLLKLYQHNDVCLNNTDIIKLECSIDDYIKYKMIKTFKEEKLDLDVYGNFIIIVDNPKILIEKSKINLYSDSTYTSLASDGLLFDQTTQSIYDYVKVEFESTTDIYTNRCSDNFELDIPFSEIPYGLLSWDCVHNEKLFNIHRKQLYLLKIYGF